MIVSHCGEGRAGKTNSPATCNYSFPQLPKAITPQGNFAGQDLNGINLTVDYAELTAKLVPFVPVPLTFPMTGLENEVMTSKTIVIVLLCFIWPASLLADEAHVKAREYAQISRQEREKEIQRLDKEIEELKEVKEAQTKIYAGQWANTKMYLRGLIERRNALAEPFTPFYAELNVINNSKLVGMGRVVWGHGVVIDGVARSARVFQVVDGGNVIFEFGSSRMISVPRKTVSGTRYLGTEPRESTNLVWLTDVDTSGLADGQSVPKSWDKMKLFEVVGNKTYATASGGSTTLKKIAPVDLEKYEELFTRLSEARTWFDTSGSPLVEGFVYGYSKGEVEFKRPDGTIERIKLTKLSKDDQKHVREEIKSRRSRQ